MFQDASPGAPSFSGDGDVFVRGHRIDVIPRVEQAVDQGTRWVSGVRFDLRLDGKADPKFTFGSIGIGASKEEAQKVAVQEWLAYFGTSFVSAILQSNQNIEADGFVVYPGLLGIRGQSTEKVVEALGDLDKRIFSALAPILSDTSSGDFPMTLSFMIVNQGDGKVEAECRLNGAETTQGVSLLKNLSWPKDGIPYLLKKYYIFKRK
jgi:hypothetical protein